MTRLCEHGFSGAALLPLPLFPFVIMSTFAADEMNQFNFMHITVLKTPGKTFVWILFYSFVSLNILRLKKRKMQHEELFEMEYNF